MTEADRRQALARAMPAVFVLIWSTGFVVARYAMPHAGPMAFLTVRFALCFAAFVLWVAWARCAWPQGRRAWMHLAVTGVLMQAGYLGGVWAAVRGGMGAGLVALIVGLQPVITALWLSGTGGQRVRSLQWLGLALGLAGLVLVVWQKLHLGLASPRNLLMAAVGLASITAGTLYQKRHVAPCDVRSASAVQMLAAVAVTTPLAWLEQAPFEWHPELIGALAWSVLVLTLGGSSLLYLLIQRGVATAVTSLMYLVPPCTALLAWWLFGESFTWLSLLGLVLTAAGVALVARAPRAAGTAAPAAADGTR